MRCLGTWVVPTLFRPEKVGAWTYSSSDGLRRRRRPPFEAGRRLALSISKSILCFASDKHTLLEGSERGTGPVSFRIKHVLVFVTVV